MSHIYFDHNATSPTRPEVITAVTEAMRVHGNPSAVHSHGRAAHRLVNDARETISLALGVCAQDVIFTASGTEANNTAILSAVKSGCHHFLISPMDHPAVITAAENSGAKVEMIPVERDGRVNMDWLSSRLSDWSDEEGRPFVALCAANSETGIIQDTQRAIELTHQAGGLILVDAVQALGKISLPVMPDYMSVSAHKIGGPMGIGALYVAADAPFFALMIGGGQERRRRAGTLNVAGIAGFGAAVKAMEANLDNMSDWADMRDKLEAGLQAMETDIVILGQDSPRLPNTSFFAIPDMEAATLLMALDLEGISVSTGMACSSGSVKTSRAILAMGVLDKAPKGAIRVSLGYTNSSDDIEMFLDCWARIRRKNLRVAV